MHAAPGGPFTSERPLPPQVLANIEAKYGLDQPTWKQLVNYIIGIVTEFDFGPSFKYKDRTVNDIIAQGFPVTLTYGTIAFVRRDPGRRRAGHRRGDPAEHLARLFRRRHSPSARRCCPTS